MFLTVHSMPKPKVDLHFMHFIYILRICAVLVIENPKKLSLKILLFQLLTVLFSFNQSQSLLTSQRFTFCDCHKVQTNIYIVFKENRKILQNEKNIHH